MRISRLLIANRGEVALRISRAATELGISTVAVYSEDDARCRHVAAADEARALSASGARAYLDARAMVDVAKDAGCDALHPGYGFLSESAELARECARAGILFVGPSAETLEIFGDKARARALAHACDVPLLPGTTEATSLDEARRFLESLGEGGAVMVKALAGGGGRGIRPVHDPAQLEEAFRRCASEARAAFGSDALYVEQYLPRARHLEVQVLGDASGAVSHLWERECTLQRRHQKLVEIAPSPWLPDGPRHKLVAAALRMAGETGYRGLGTFEFLVDAEAPEHAPRFAFMEANPRLQVEHTVTEEVTGVDLVQTQLRLAEGASLAELGLSKETVAPPRGISMQLRINAETLDAEGHVHPSGGVLQGFEPPAGPGIRVDSHAYAGYSMPAGFDSLLAKLVATARSARFEDVVAKGYRALCELRTEGLATNTPLLQNVLTHPDVAAGRFHTRFIDENLATLVEPGAHRPRYVQASDGDAPGAAPRAVAQVSAPPGTTPLKAPMQSRVVSVDVNEGDAVRRGQQVAVVEAMKMEHVVLADAPALVRKLAAKAGDQVLADQPLLFVTETQEAGEASESSQEEVDLDFIRPDLAEVRARKAHGLDAHRPEAVAKRHGRGGRTARENIDDLCDVDSFVEYGSMVIAAQRRRRSVEDLIQKTPADGLITGIGTVNRALFGEEAARCMILAYDYMVMAGTQGMANHKKLDRMLDIAEQWRIPLVLFAEGGGGRPGDTDWPMVGGLDLPSFRTFARLSGLLPRISIVSGRCFAGNAALAGCSDVMIATRSTTIGMGGPAMIEGGGLGRFRPEEVGPVEMQEPNGVLDLVVEDEAEAVAKAKQLLSYFQGPLQEWNAPDQRWLRRAIPENRLRVYDVRYVIDTLADEGSLLELRPRFGQGMITAFIRIEGRPVGLVANNPQHLGGAIDAEGADKAARFMQLCDAFDIPIVTLCDTPGIMVGPDAERTGMVRHASRLFLVGASVQVPILTVVLRKGYGLGAQAMAGGSFQAPFFLFSWPTGEFGGMGLEGAVQLGFRKELEAIEDPKERQKAFEQMVAAAYEHGKATNAASYLEIDEVIDPADTRFCIVRALQSLPPAVPREGKRRPFVDAW